MPVKFLTFEMLALCSAMRMKSMCTINCVRNPLLSENRQRLPIIGTYLRITVCLRVRGWLSPRRILIVRDSPRKILDGSFLPASLLEHIAGISMCHQHQRPCYRRSNSYLSVTPITLFPTYRPQSKDGSLRTSFRKQN